jgi:urea transport system substrate-binding protein
MVLTGCEKQKTPPQDSIRVGILHSQTGLLSSGERNIMQATLLAIEQINNQGGVLGARIDTVIVDGASDPATFREKALELIDTHKVSAIFGCLASDCRKAVKSVVEERQSVLFYPMIHEGLEQSPNIIYMGPCPNQFALPAVQWAYNHFGKRFVLVGCKSHFSCTLNAILRKQIEAIGGTVLAEFEYGPATDQCDHGELVDFLEQHKPDTILTTQGTRMNQRLFAKIEQRGSELSRIPVFVLGMSSMDVSPMMVGKYTAWGYCETLPGPVNQSFVEAYRRRYGPQDFIADPMVSGYLAVYLWAKAVHQAGTAHPLKVLKAIPNQSIQGPAGLVYISPVSHHAYRNVRLGKINAIYGYEIAWDSQAPLAPDPYPMFATYQEWEKMVSVIQAQLEHQAKSDCSTQDDANTYHTGML